MAATDSPKKGGAHPLITGLSNVKTSPKWSFGGRLTRLSSMVVPGPGAYGNTSVDCTSKFTKGARFGFGTATRARAYEKPVPGPGSYGHKTIVGQGGPAFTCVPRREGEKMQKDMPGPGSHDLPDLVGKTGPKYTGTPRRAEFTRAIVPGPGAYDQDDHATSEGKPRWGFGTAQRTGIADKRGECPGPGTYTQITLLGSKSPQYSIQARRDAARAIETPGPGAHGGHFTQFGY